MKLRKTETPKTADIHFRVTVEEKNDLQKIADALGLTLSAYLVWCGSQYVGRKMGDVILDYYEKTGNK